MKKQIPLALWFVRWFFPKLEWLSGKLAVEYFEKIFFTPLRYTPPGKERECEQEAIFEKIVANELKIQTYTWGHSDKPYVLVMHGWAGRATQFQKFIPELIAAGYRVVGFDGPAHGHSSGKRTNIMEFETAFKMVFQRWGEPVGIIAHSFGGGAALYAIMNGLPVKKLINIASPTMADEIIRSYLRAINGSWKTGEAFKKLIKRKYGKEFEEFTAMYFIEHIKGLDLMLVHDEDDRDVPVFQAEKLIEKYPSARLLRTSGLGHNRILKDELVIRACIDFIRN
ncbi:MAG: alpha/beta hydrolase [Cyclobacteriaceae bacterium]|nr:alpha/beta hydrolase [Cyclobacteriaceae bacterium]